MGSPRILKKVINGRLTVTRPRRDCVEVLVYAGETVESEMVGEWDMPRSMHLDLPLAAETAEHQTPRG